MAGEESGEGITVSVNASSTVDQDYSHLPVYDFHKMVALDWDKVYDGPMNQLLYTSWNGLNIGRLTLAIWILASHLALILFVLGKAKLREQPKNILIINLSLANMLLGVFLVPIKLHFILTPGVSDCSLSKAWAFLNDYFQVCLSLLAVLGLVVERLVYVFTERRGRLLTRFAKWFNCALYILLPWLLSILLLVPIFLTALAQSVPGEACAYRVRERHLLAVQIISFLPAATALFFAAPAAGLLDCLRSKECHALPSTPRGESLAVACLVSVLAVCGEAPYFVVRALLMRLECSNPYCARFNAGVTAGMWVRIAKAAVLPFLWLAYSDFRDALLCRFNYKKVKDESVSEDDDRKVMNTKM